MADAANDTKLSKEAKEQIVAHLKQKAPNFSCAICGHRNFTLGDHLVTGVITSQQGGVMLGGTNYPMVLAVCNNCFHTVHFAAVPIGLPLRVKSESPEKKDGGDG